LPLDTRSRTPSKAALDLPPPFRLVTLREHGDAFAHATRVAAEEGAGTLVHVGRFDLAEFAVVLEPEEPLQTARRAFYAGMCALADALSANAPPEKPITVEWPGTIYVDQGLVGGGRLAWPADAADHAVPAWIVFGAMIRTAAMVAEEPGLYPFAAALEDEGFDDLGTGRLVEGFARHLMVATDTWHHDGFDALAKSYLARLTPESGTRREIDANGDLLLRRTGAREVERRPLVRALAESSWLDPTAGEPRR
jgi:biotin-(acetyl-CoA carboxylase) ligase